MSSRRILLNAAGTLRAGLARAAQHQQHQHQQAVAAASAAAASPVAPAAAAAAAAAALPPATHGFAAAAPARLFSASSSPSADGDQHQQQQPPSLLSVLKREIKHEKSAYSPPAVVASGPPAPFTLVDVPGEAAVSLKREYRGGETITVECSVNLQDALGPPPGFEDDEDDEDEEAQEEQEQERGRKAGGSGEEGDDDEDDEDEDDEDPGDVAFNVTVSKGASGPSLVFECVSDGTYVDVRHVALEGAGGGGKRSGGGGGGEDDDGAYSGPVFDELDEELQDAFRGYLEARGVDEDLGEYLRWLLVDKEQREYTAWLEGVKGFIGDSGK